MDYKAFYCLLTVKYILTKVLFANNVPCINDGHYKVVPKKIHKMQDFLVWWWTTFNFKFQTKSPSVS